MTFRLKVSQIYHKVTRNESKESYADKKLDHSPIVTYLEKGKTIGLHQELDITDGMVELDGEPLSSADVEISTHIEMQPFSSRSLQYSFAGIWLGQKWFESFLAMWVVNELPPRTPLMEIKVSRLLEYPVEVKAFVNACFRNRKNIETQ